MRFGLGNGMYEKVSSFIEKHHMLEGIERVVVGLSGGADSVCLLFMLRRYIEEKKLSGKVKLTAVHVHHGIRGEAADEDAFFCRELCASQDIEYKQYNYDVPTLAAQSGIGEEAMGRKLRYETFRECIKAGERGVIAVAHHQNDQAETVLFHLVRGSHIKGTRGMEPVSGQIIRPLLCSRRSEIEAWAEENNISYCTDMSNYSEDYTRNCLRLKVIPYLEEHVNRQAVPNICAYADRMAEINEYIDGQTDAAYDRYVNEAEGHALFVSEELCREHHVIQSAVLYRGLAALAGRQDLEQKHIEACISLFGLQCGRSISLPGRITAQRTYGGMKLSALWHTNDVQEASECPDFRLLTEEMGDFCGFSSWRELIRAIIDKKLINDSYTKFFDYGKIKKHIADCGENIQLAVRHRQEGDYMVIDHAGHKKKLKELFIDAKIPAESRDAVWLFTVGSMVLWAVGVRGTAWFWADEATTQLIRLEVKGAGAGRCMLEETNEGKN